VSRRSGLEAAARAWRDAVRREARVGASREGVSLEWCDSLRGMAPQQIYDLFGHFWDDTRRRPAPRLAPYQLDVWADIMGDTQLFEYLKGQKLGFTTFMHMLTVFRALTVDRGNSIYIVSQDMGIAIDHLNNLKNYMRQSRVLRPYLIERPMRDRYGEIVRATGSKTTKAVIANPEAPDDPDRQTVIYAKSIVAGQALISHRRVSYVHMSDISAAKLSDSDMEQNFTRVITRLLNTGGKLVMESPPSIYRANLMTRVGFGVLEAAIADQGKAAATGPDGEFHRDGRAYDYGDWRVRRLPTLEIGVGQGVITQKTYDLVKDNTVPVEFERTCDASMRTGENRAFDRGMADQVGPDATAVVESWLASVGGKGPSL